MKEVTARQQFVIRKYLQGFEDNNQDLDLTMLEENFDGTVDVDRIDLESMGLNQGGSNNNKEESINIVVDDDNDDANHSQFTERAARVQELFLNSKRERRDILKNIRAVRSDIDQVSKEEIFNAKTGVGELKKSSQSLSATVPLGYLQLNLERIIGLDDEEEFNSSSSDDSSMIGVKVFLRPSNIPSTSFDDFSSSIKSSNCFYSGLPCSTSSSVLVFNQSIGPIAPISSRFVDVCLEVIDFSSERVLLKTDFNLHHPDFTPQVKVLRYLRLFKSSPTKSVLSTNATMEISVNFQFSKLLFLRAQLIHLQGRLSSVEKTLAEIRSGKFVDNEL